MSKPVLYHAPQSRSSRVAWLINEINLDVDIKGIDFSKGEHKSPEFLKVNPNGCVPAYVEGENTIVESGAIVMYLADKHGKLIPKDKSKYYQWITYAVATLDPSLEIIFVENVFKKDKANKELVAEKTARLKKHLDFVQSALGDNKFLVDNTFSAADIVLGYSLNWANAMGLLKDHPKLQEYLGNLSQREAFKKAFAPLK